MKLIRFDDASQYYQRIESYLLQDEAVNCLPLASSSRLCKKEDYDKASYLALVENEGTILTTAIHIRDRRLLLSKSSDVEAVELIARDLAVSSPSIPGITAPQTEAETFVVVWRSLTQQSTELKVVMLIQQLEQLNALDSAVGRLRLAALDEIELITEWIQAFVKEALGVNELKADSQQWAIRHLEENSLYVWENNKLVSMASYGGKTPNGIRIGSVYTPPKDRGRGYATSCVAAMSRLLLEQQRYCFLFTDVANSTSNKIYAQIGYKPMGKIKDYKFYG